MPTSTGMSFGACHRLGELTDWPCRLGLGSRPVPERKAENQPMKHPALNPETAIFHRESDICSDGAMVVATVSPYFAAKMTRLRTSGNTLPGTCTCAPGRSICTPSRRVVPQPTAAPTAAVTSQSAIRTGEATD
jgi:hypothetical protein